MKDKLVSDKLCSSKIDGIDNPAIQVQETGDEGKSGIRFPSEKEKEANEDQKEDEDTSLVNIL